MKKIIALILVFSMIFGICACGSKKEEPQPEPEPVVEPEPEPEPEPILYPNPLTGLMGEVDYSKNRPYAVMLNNLKDALPQCGLFNADIIFEMNVEGNITRMMALFQHMDDFGPLGSIRSSRPYYLDLALAFDAIYIHAGGSEQAYSDMKTRKVDHIDGVRWTEGQAIFYRDAERRKKAGYEHSMFTTAAKVNEIVPTLSFRQEHQDGYSVKLKFSEDVKPSGEAAKELNVRMNSKKTTGFVYDITQKGYRISEYGAPYVDGNSGEQLWVDNVLILQVKYWNVAGDTYGRLGADMSGGEGWYAYGGCMKPIKWTMSQNNGLKLFTESGTDLLLKPGRSYVCCVDKSTGGVDIVTQPEAKPQ